MDTQIENHLRLAPLKDIYSKKINDLGFMNTYTVDKNASIISEFNRINGNTSLTNDQIVTDQIKDDIVNTMYGDGYISQSLVYILSSIFLFFAPSVVKIFGHKISMVSTRLS